RFFHKACRDLGITEGNEPMQQLRNQGMILGNDGEKMSKSRGNVIAPDDIVKVHGADTVRAYLMFFSRWELGGPWSAGGIEGTSRWIRRVWSIIMEPAETRPVSDEVIKSLRRKLHQSLKSIQRDFIEFGFNTVVSTLMELLNEMSKAKQAGVYGTEVWKEAVRIYLLMLAPVTPHLAEEIWTQLGYPYSIHQQAWPIVDEESAKDEEITLIIQVNGKVRDRIVVPVGLPEEEAKSRALSSEAVQKFLEGKTPRQVIYVRGKLINIVI
ncbi:MAG TPA: class I tRNA ligase family protein, partial [Bellilinea sp.]|nr:class I tRNA ligase family protein [Bellilinea sp.]